MNKLTMLVAKLWMMVAQWKYYVVAQKAAWNTLSCGYDDATMSSRVNEAMGLAMLTEWIRFEHATVKKQNGWKTDWQEAKIVTMCSYGGALLRKAGWTDERMQRTIDQIDAKAQE